MKPQLIYIYEVIWIAAGVEYGLYVYYEVVTNWECKPNNWVPGVKSTFGLK